MRRFLLTLASAATLVAPMAAHAEFNTPGELLTAIQQQSARSFTATVHGSSDDVYVSVWANGSSEGTDAATAKVKTSATVDVVKGDMKVRAKADMAVADGTAYLKLNSFNASFLNDFGSLNTVLTQKKWLQLPMEGEFLGTNATFMDINNMNVEQADTMYTMQHTVSKGVNVYTLGLTPDSAIDLALQIRQLLGDEKLVSNDFFPWRELAEGMHFELVIRTDDAGHFLSSTLTTSMATANAGFNAVVNETALKNGVTVTAPKDALTMDQLMMMFNSSPAASYLGDEMMVPAEPVFLPAGDSMMADPSSMMPFEPSATWGMGSQTDPQCMDPDLTDLQMVSLQRSGTCPVTKVPTRADEYRTR